MRSILYIVIPCYNEEAVLKETARQLKELLGSISDRISPKSRVIFVNDGSRDRTWKLIEELHEEDSLFGGISLSRNRGHQNALLAGLMTVKPLCDMAISMDADLQDDPRSIIEMLDRYYEGFDIVYGVRSQRDTDSFFKRFTAEGFYRLMNSLGGAELVYNHADFRLMSRRALDGLEEFHETNLFLRGIIPMIGYPSTCVYYERHERFAGESKYPLRKMLSFAFEGITSLSDRPISLIIGLGSAIFGISILMLIWTVSSFFCGTTVPGWSSLMVSIWAIGGLLILSVGVVGKYIGKIYLETKARPRYLIESFLNDAQTEDEE